MNRCISADSRSCFLLFMCVRNFRNQVLGMSKITADLHRKVLGEEAYVEVI